MAGSGLVACRMAAMIAGLWAAWPAAAQTYKWVDERGATHYSNTRPTLGILPGRIDPVAERVTVYTPDEPLKRAIEERRREEAASRQDGRKRELEPLARGTAAGGGSSVYERCLSERRVDCDPLAAAPAGYVERFPIYLPVYLAGAAKRGPGPQGAVAPGSYVEPRVGVDSRPPVGIDNRPPVGIDTRPPVGVDNRAPVGMPARGRPTVPQR